MEHYRILVAVPISTEFETDDIPTGKMCAPVCPHREIVTPYSATCRLFDAVLVSDKPVSNRDMELRSFRCNHCITATHIK